MAQAEYTTEVLADTPVAFWKLDEASGLPQDSSGNGLHMTSSSGSPIYQQAGPFSGALAIDSNDGSFSRTIVSTATDNFTLEIWLRVQTSLSSDVFRQSSGAAGNGWRISPSSGLLVRVVAASTNLDVCPSTASWRMLNCVRRSGTWEYYQDGDVWSSNAGTTAPGPYTSALTSLSHGSGETIFSNVSIYETALSGARIRAHYEAAVDWQARPLASNRAVTVGG